MSHLPEHLAKLTRLLGVGALSAAVGCNGTGRIPACADIPPGAVPQNSGTYTCQWQAAQAQRAELDDFVIYLNEWSLRTSTLAQCGQAHIARLADRLAGCANPVVIQPSGETELDQARQAAIIELLAMRGVLSPGNRVVIATPEAEGLYGFEAPRIIRGYSQSGTYNSGAGGTGSGFGGSTGTNVGAGFGTGYGGGGFNTGGIY
jgi:hypothetical protein